MVVSVSVLGRLPGTTAFVAREHAQEARTAPGVLGTVAQRAPAVRQRQAPPRRHPGRAGHQGVALWLGGVHAEVLGMLERSGPADDIGRAHLYRNLVDAAGDARPETPG